MRHLVVGAGATLAEAVAAGVRPEHWPPVISNFAQRMWSDFNPHPFLDRYLESLGHAVANEDGRDLFYKLEAEGITNVERFFEFAWQHREKSWNWSNNPKVRSPGASAGFRPNDDVTGLPKDFIKEFRLTSAGPKSIDISSCEMDYWENLLCLGIGREMQLVMIQCFGQSGGPGGFRNLHLSQSVIRQLSPGDLIVNLNYDTAFEIALTQLTVPFAYTPNPRGPDEILVAKPHGSINMVVNPRRRSFTFGQPEWLGSPDPPEGRAYLGLVPPRLHKTYEQHPIAKMILGALRNRFPDELIFWGIGVTESDADLIDLYRAWARRARVVQFINPDREAAIRASQLLARDIEHVETAADWVALMKR